MDGAAFQDGVEPYHCGIVHMIRAAAGQRWTRLRTTKVMMLSPRPTPWFDRSIDIVGGSDRRLRRDGRELDPSHADIRSAILLSALLSRAALYPWKARVTPRPATPAAAN